MFTSIIVSLIRRKHGSPSLAREQPGTSDASSTNGFCSSCLEWLRSDPRLLSTASTCSVVEARASCCERQGLGQTGLPSSSALLLKNSWISRNVEEFVKPE